MPRNFTMLAISIFVTACGTQSMPAAPMRVPAVTLANASTLPTATESYVYSPAGKRDPFTTVHARESDDKSPLQQWSLEQLNLKGTVTGTASPSAVILDPQSRAWLVRLGDYVGNKAGRVTSIERDQIVVTETIDGGGLFPQPIKLGQASAGSVDAQDHMIDVPPAK